MTLRSFIFHGNEGSMFLAFLHRALDRSLYVTTDTYQKVERSDYNTIHVNDLSESTIDDCKVYFRLRPSLVGARRH